MNLVRVWHYCTDLIFPPSVHELRVRKLTPEKLALLRTIPHARETETLFSYKHGDIRALMWQLKYKNDRRSALLLAGAIGEHLQEVLDGPHLLIPLPLSPKRERSRGYNQIVSVCAHLTLPPTVTLCPHGLARIRDTPPQTKLSRYERLKNMHGAFAVPDPLLIKGKDIILLDDVTTTGATLREAKETLLAAGAESVRCIALAH